ncbi:MAG: Ribonuclease BN [Gemmatimonadaceae bacterium]|nr:Ribonuclease BN [Gemmatimonadaceae bacterium]
MRLRFWGTRGSCPSPGPSTNRYGGNTTCLEVRTDDDDLLIFDAGTGIRELGLALIRGADGSPIRGEIFFSHAHWDHIQGLPFFTPAFQHGNDFTLWGSPTLFGSLGVVLRQQMSPVVFPVGFDALRARLEVRALEGQRRSGSGYDVRTIDVRHPGGALGFRVSAAGQPGRSFVFIPDNELDPSFDERDGQPRPASREALVEFARGAQVLIHDAMYTGTEYMEHRGWGHSSYRDAIEFALAADVQTLVLFHHEPDREDTALDSMLQLCHEMVAERGGSLEIVAAAEGMEIGI